MNRFVHRIKSVFDNRGTGYIDVVITFLVFAMLLAFFVATVPIFLQSAALNTTANDIARLIEVQGEITFDSVADAKDLGRRRNLEIDSVTFDPSYGEIPLNEEFTVIVRDKAYLGFGPFPDFPVQLEAEAVGVSQVYWK